jgi:hypothetical protein
MMFHYSSKKKFMEESRLGEKVSCVKYIHCMNHHHPAPSENGPLFLIGADHSG